MRRSFQQASLAALVAIATAGFSSAALAHVGDHSHMGFTEGLLHPFSGLDHVLAMVAVGLWASQLGGRALWLLPLTFPVVMAAGAALGFERRGAAVGRDRHRGVGARARRGGRVRRCGHRSRSACR